MCVCVCVCACVCVRMVLFSTPFGNSAFLKNRFRHPWIPIANARWRRQFSRASDPEILPHTSDSTPAVLLWPCRCSRPTERNISVPTPTRFLHPILYHHAIHKWHANDHEKYAQVQGWRDAKCSPHKDDVRTPVRRNPPRMRDLAADFDVRNEDQQRSCNDGSVEFYDVTVTAAKWKTRRGNGRGMSALWKRFLAHL
jgi:hypothetical protein